MLLRFTASLLALAAAGAFGAVACNKKPSKTEAEALLSLKRLDDLPEFALQLDAAAWASLKNKPKKWVHGDFFYQGRRYADVGVRIKGNRSLRKVEDKPALKIRFDKYNKAQRFLGLRSLTLNNMVEDPTLLREVLGYRLYRQLDVPAPFAFYARVSINGEDRGLYVALETVNEDFITARFSDSSGSVYEGEYGCDLYVADVDGFDRDLGDKALGRADLLRLAQATDGSLDALFDAKGPLDMDTFLSYLAVSAFIGDFDGYRHAHNYRIYHEPTLDKWFFLPWGIDRAFKKRLSIFESYGRLAKLCFRHAACRAQYVRKQKLVLDRFAQLNLPEGALALAGFIESVVTTSERHRASAKRINQQRNRLLAFLRERPEEIYKETACIAADGREIDADRDGFACLDCDDSDASVHPGAQELCDGRDNDCSLQVDDNPACSTCPIQVVGDNTFALCDFPRTWSEAARYCSELGGTLARVESKEANKKLAEAARDARKGAWWIGLNDRESEGQFLWSDGTPAAFASFAKGEPDNNTCNQDCVVVNARKQGLWRDTHCGQPLPFICSL